MMLKPVRQEKKEIPFNALSGPDEESSAALSKGTQAFFDYIYDCYLITERLDVLAPQSAARQEH